MKPMMIASLILNIVVLIPVTTGLLVDASWATASYGASTAARGILLSIYLAILVASALLLFVRDPRMVAALVGVQIIYKILTPFTVGTLQNPVVISNLGIAAFHMITVFLIWRSGS